MRKTNDDTTAEATSDQRTAIPEDMRDLTVELEALQQLLLQHSAAQSDNNAGGSSAPAGLVAITRLFPGMSIEQWRALAESHGLHEWLALSLDKSSFLNLRHLQRALEELAHQSEHDPLTGLVNRRAFERRLHMEAERVERSNGNVCLAVLDIDNFKQVNDTYGHPCGDEVLCGLSGVLEETKRAYDVAARLGGEEFALLLPGATPLRAKSMVERVLHAFGQHHFACEGHAPFACTFSGGVACLRGNDSLGIAQLMELADQALYEAKRAGKNRIHIARQRQEIEYDRSTMVHSNEKQFLFSGIE